MSTVAQKGKNRPVAGAIGNVLEWYDFAVFGFLAPVISPLFFPAEDPLAGLIKTYGVFALGYLMRPLGGLLFGYIGDRLGRKRALQISISMMAVPTVLIGLLPTHSQIGVSATLLLIFMRLLQGISVGGELTGSIAYLVESARPGRRGLQGSWSVVGAISGILLGSLVISMLHQLVNASDIATWGWRIPFLLGAVIFAAGAWLRRDMQESPDFLAAEASGQTQENPVLHVLREMPLRILHTSASLLLFSASFYMLFVWMPTYLTRMVTPPVESASLINTISMCLLLVLIPLAAMVSDKFGRKQVLFSAMLVFAIAIYPLFVVIDHAHFMLALGVQCIFAVMVAFLQGPTPAFLVESFATQGRYTAIGLSYNLTLAIFGGTAPMVSTWLVQQTGNLASPAIYLVVLAVLSMLALATLKAAPQEQKAV